jgi:hypothetical protein
MLSGLAAQAALAALIAVASFGGGWMVNGWRLSGEIERMESRQALTDSANRQCAADIKLVRASTRRITDALAAKEAEAKAAMSKAETEARKRAEMARRIQDAPIHEGETQCQAVEREQIEYVQSRSSE